MDYVELHAHSNFSFLDGASHPENLLQRAAELKHSALALTDHDNVSGAVRFSQAAKEYSVRPIFGAEITLHDGHHLLLLVKNANWLGKPLHARHSGTARRAERAKPNSPPTHSKGVPTG